MIRLLLTCMRVRMDLHVNFLVESFGAIRAGERLVVGVRTHVSMKIRRSIECLKLI